MKNSIEKLFSLKGKVAIVTGGAMGIGKGIALRLAEAGANIMIVDIIAPKEAAETIKEVTKNGVLASYIQVDLREIKNLSNIIDQTIKEFGDIHILVNNAGIYTYCPVTELSEELWDNTLNLNLKAVAFLSKLVAKKMIERKHGGKIINISSIDSIKPTGNLSQYDASKGGIRMLTRAFAKELGQYGILVNDIAPGGVKTPGVAKISGTTLTAEQQKAMSAQTEQFIKMLPLQRMGEPEEIGNAALFLASDASNYMTGSTMVVDGGLLIM
ncbi:MAG: glucose 1-dehydrogenase [Chitinophagales bacterium]|nr:glucose 1-dehydrogenase [Chitinophagales bacterium]